MSIKGFSVNGAVQRYDYTALDNLPQGQGVSDDLKAALLQLAQKVAYIDDQGQTYYDDLYDALYPEKTLLSIAANFQQGQAVVYNTDSLDSLKQYLTVTATYDDASTETVPSSAYTLSGTLTTGTSVITVTYEGKTDAFNVTVTAAPMALTVTNNLTGCTTSNSATSVLENTSYTAVITASSGYTLVGATVSITMGGNDITTSAYSGGIITINSVTGALVISVAAVAVVLNSISAVYTQSGTVYDTDTLDSLKADLVVTAHYSDSSTQTVPAADYTLSGTLTAGTSTITVSYGGKTTTFDVTVEHYIEGWYYPFNGSLLSVGTEDFGFTGEEVYTEGLFGRQAYSRVIPSGTAVENRQQAIKALNVPKYPNFGGDYTLSFWAKTQTAGAGYPFWGMTFKSGNASSSYYTSPTTQVSGWTVAVGGNSLANTGYGFQIYNGNISLRVVNGAMSNTGGVTITPPSSFSTTSWHHYAVTRKGNTVRLFVDGVLTITVLANESTVYSANQVSVWDLFKNSAGSVPTDLSGTANGGVIQDLYIAEFCKWETDFDPQTIVY